jgi:choline kinase
MRAIIIAAGRGRRLMPLTADTPKCFAEVQGKRLLDWDVAALKAAGVTEICLIGGYQIDKIRAQYPEFTFRHNDNWENNNILLSLMYAEDLMDQPFISTYADVLYTRGLVKGLIDTKGDIVLSVDTCWQKRYEHRTMHPADDGEKVLASNGVVTRVHRNIAPNDAHGEFTGLAKFSAEGARQLKEHFNRCKQLYAGKPFREAAVFEKSYFILLLQEMIEHGVKMHHADSPGSYVEVDTQQDFELAQTFWKGDQ